jgi:hypothetical protein
VTVTTDGVWGLMIGFTGHLQNATTSNCSAIANSHSLQHVLSLLSLLCLHQSLSGNGFQRRTSLNFRIHVLTVRRPFHDKLNSRLVLLITPRHGQHRKHRFQQLYCCDIQLSRGLRKENRFPVSPLLRVRNLLPSNGPCLQSHYLATDPYATLYSV